MKKRAIIVLLCLVLLGALGCWRYRDGHIFVEDAVYDRDVRFLDLRGQQISLEHYETLRRELPFCDILWDVPFQGGGLPCDTTEIAVERLSMEDVERLDYLTQLQRVDGQKCRDYAALAALEQRRPEIEVAYTVVVGGEAVDRDAVALVLADGEGLPEAIPYLPKLKSVHLADGALPAESLLRLREACPDISFTWEKAVLGTLYPDTLEILDLSGREVGSLEELEADLAYFPELKELLLCDMRLDNAAAAALRDNLRERCKVVWTLYMDKITVRSDATTLMPFLFGYSGLGKDRLKGEDCVDLKYLENMVCMDLGHMALDDIEFVRYMPDLEYLLVADTGISDISPVAGLEKLKYFEFFHNEVTDISALAACPALEDVNMCYNEITDISPLLEMDQLKNLWMSGGYLTEQQQDQLREALPGTHMEFFVEGSVGKGWRKLPNYYAQRDLLGVWYLE